MFEDTKGAIRIRISQKDRQHNGQKKKYKSTNNDLQNIHIKLKIELQRSTQHTHTTKDRITRTTLKTCLAGWYPYTLKTLVAHLGYNQILST